MRIPSRHLLKKFSKLMQVACLSVVSLFCLLSCGLEDFYYIDYIEDSDYNDTRASIRLPSSSDEGYGVPNKYFSNFIIFYRIYISDAYLSSRIETVQQLTDINSALVSDYRGFENLTDKTSTTVTTSNLENTFYSSQRQYFKLALEGADIDTVLGNGAVGSSRKTLEIAFLTTSMPTLTLDGISYTLLRARERMGTVPFTIRPDNRYFLNHSDLYTTSTTDKELNINVDVATNSNPACEYTYVSLYIAAIGKSGEMPPRTIYSQPTFIGIFRLPNSSDITPQS